MSQLGDIVGKTPQRKFVNVNISRIVTPESQGDPGKPNLQRMTFKPLTLTGSRKSESEAEAENRSLRAKLRQQEKEIQNLKNEVTRKAAEARAAGVAEGLVQGKEAAAAEMKKTYATSVDALRDTIAQALEELSGEKQHLFGQYEIQIMELFLACLKKYLNIHVVENQDAVLHVLANAVRSLGEVRQFSLKVHPDDFKSITDRKNIWLPLNTRFEDIHIDTDKRVNRGGLILESSQTSVEVSFDKILQNLEQEFLKVFQKHIRSEPEVTSPAIAPAPKMTRAEPEASADSETEEDRPEAASSDTQTGPEGKSTGGLLEDLLSENPEAPPVPRPKDEKPPGENGED